MKQFDPYELIGVIIPGSIIAATATVEVETFKNLVGTEGTSLGGLGMFVIAAFIFGHLVQSFGNGIEQIIWLVGGWPTDRVRSIKQSLISSDQRRQLQDMVCSMEGNEQPLEAYNAKDWRSVTARISSRLKATGRSTGVDFANRNYGLFRGIAAALLLVIIWYTLASEADWAFLVVLVVMLVAALFRMRRFGRLYARNLFQSFIDIDTAAKA